MLQRLIHFRAIVSYYVQYVNTCCSVYLIFSTGLVLPRVCQHVLQRLIHFSVLVKFYLHYVKICCSCYSILQHWSGITYTWSTCAAADISFYNTGLVLSTLGQHELQRLHHFSALVSYYLHYVKNMRLPLLHFSALISTYLQYVNMCCSG
jgi:hypothetical protein